MDDQCIESSPYSELLEEIVKSVYELKPICFAFAMTTEDGTTYTAYHNADATDKAVFAHHIQSDVTMDIIRANADLIRDMLEAADDD